MKKSLIGETSARQVIDDDITRIVHIVNLKIKSQTLERAYIYEFSYVDDAIMLGKTERSIFQRLKTEVV